MHPSSSELRQRIAADIAAQLPVGTFNLSIDQAATILGCHPGHIRNQISNGVFPIDTVTLGKRRLVPLTNLIDYLVELIACRQTIKPKRGRRSKALRRVLRAQLAQENIGNAAQGRL